MMENKTNIFKRFHAAIITQHVFIEDEQVFLKKEIEGNHATDNDTVDWSPTDFEWVPISL